ncbi:11854_t:CDS:2 [Ambispora gerdemannii]|uniref:11854_t:CDS:1 n=1 Tax=Ambispora gerdemannii TaxID=144530 RepID=A0A9N9AMG6_9GLOM|nr:11854_t:CDS:2 [Ambispora gerdemannii]
MTTFKTFDDLDQQRELAFMQLRPTCVSLLKSTPLTRVNSQQVLQTLDELIQTLYSLPAPSRFLNVSLVEYIFLPLAHVFQSAELPRSDKFTEKFLTCLLFLLETSWTSYMKPELFKQIFIMLTSIMGTSSESSSNKSYLVSLISEETNLLAIKCILALLGREKDNQDSSNNVILRAELIKELLEPSHRAAIGRCVYVLLDIIFKERLLELRISAVDALERLVQCLDDTNVLAAILPGVVSTLGKTIIRDQKENHRLLVRSIEALGEIICRVMNDEVSSYIMTRHRTLNELVEEFIETTGMNAKKSTKVNQTSKDIFDENSNNTISSAAVEVLRNKSWLRATKSQINILLCQIFTIRNHPSWQVRLAFVNFSNLIICQCSESLDNCLPILIETLVLYLTDEYEQVSNSSLQYLESLRKSHSFNEIFVPIMKESFDNWLNLLPQYVMGIDENAKFNVIALVTGFLSILGLNVQTVFNTSLQRVSHGLIKALEYDLTDIQIIENKIDDTGNYDNIDPSKRQQKLPSFPHPMFRHIREERVILAMRNMLRHFGYFGNLSFLINHFFFYFQNSKDVQLCPQCIFIVNELLIGASSSIKIDSTISPQFSSSIVKQINISNSKSANSLEEVQRIVKFLLREYTELDLTKEKEDKNLVGIILNTTIEPNFSISTDQQLDKKLQYKENIQILITNCLILEGIANVSNILQKKFRVELIYALYPILEKYNKENSHIMVHEIARIALYHIAINCGYNSSKNLVLENVDYLINVISRKLNQITFYPETTKVLIAMINVVGSTILPFLNDSIEEIFHALDQYHMDEFLLSQLANVLHVLVKVIANDYNEENDEFDEKQKSINNIADNNITVESSTSTIKNFHYDDDIVGISREISEFVANYSKKENEVRSTIGNDETAVTAKSDKIENYFMDSENIQSIESTTDTNKDNNNKLSMAQTICLNIINKLLHFLTASSPQLRRLILDLIRISLPKLESNMEQLYPLIHQIWPSIITRMKDKEHYVILAAVELIEKISISCGDFISNRVVIDAWPLFQHILNQQLLMDKESAISYSTYSKSHRFKLSIIITMRTVIKRVLLADMALFQIMDTMVIFLSDKVHPELKSASHELFVELIKKSPDAVWLLLNGLLQMERKVQQQNPVIFKQVIWPNYHVSIEQVDEYISSINLLLEKIDIGCVV